MNYKIVSNFEEAREYGKLCYVIGKDGIYVYNKDAFGEILVPTSSVPFGDDISPVCIYNGPRIPLGMIWEAFSFFKAVYKEHKAEAELQIWYNAEAWANKKEVELRFLCPTQEVGSADVDWIIDDETIQSMKGFVPLAELHSHGSMGAFQSGTDQKTEVEGMKCGIAITFGHVDKGMPSLHVRIMALGQTFDCEDITIAIDLGEEVIANHPEEWHKNVSKKTYTSSKWNNRSGCQLPVTQGEQELLWWERDWDYEEEKRGCKRGGKK